MTIDVARARPDTPGCSEVLHLNSAGAALRGRLSEVTVRDLGARRAGIVSFGHARHEAEAVKQAMSALRINVSVTDAISTRLDMERSRLADMVRASVHYYNINDELERFVAAIAAL